MPSSLDQVAARGKSLPGVLAARLTASLLAAPLVALPALAAAQTEPQAAVQGGAASETYPAAFFAAFSPRTALDMLEQVPGFSLETGDQGRRGLAGGGGNLLVDGEHPATKSGGLLSVLSAIPAGQVMRIEIIRAREGGLSGAAAVANIVLVNGGDSVEAGIRVVAGGRQAMERADLIVTRGLGGFDMTSRTGFEGSGERSHGSRIRRDSNGLLRKREDLDYRTDFPEWSQRVTLSGSLAGGRIRADFMAARAVLEEAFAFRDAEISERFPKETERWRGEVAADWTRALGANASVRLTGLARLTDLESLSTSEVSHEGPTFKTTSTLESESVSSERILRGVLRRGKEIWGVELGAEIAWNNLDSRSLLLDAIAAPSNAPATAKATEVFESRIETFAILTWTPQPLWSLEAGLAAETSKIKAEGEHVNKNEFHFFKPHLVVAFKPDDRTDLRLSLRRTVGQLSFGDFAASASLVAGTTSGGNPDLRPDQRTTLAFDYDRRFGGRGAIGFKTFYDWRRDVLEASVLPSGEIGVANVKTAQAWGLTARLEIPTDVLIPGGAVKLDYRWSGSRLLDPVTRESRTMNNHRPETLTIAFRQDISSLQSSWGLTYAAGVRSTAWHADETREQIKSANLGLFAETSRFLDLRVRLEANAVTGARNVFTRRLFTPDRRGLHRHDETWEIHTPLSIGLSAHRTF